MVEKFVCLHTITWYSKWEQGEHQTGVITGHRMSAFTSIMRRTAATVEMNLLRIVRNNNNNVADKKFVGVWRRRLSTGTTKNTRQQRGNTGTGSSSYEEEAAAAARERNKGIALHLLVASIFVFGASYASVPLYKVFCQMTGFGGTTQRVDDVKAITVKPVSGHKIIKVDFASNVHDAMPWTFRPTQSGVKLIPGETALAFFTVRNNSDKAVTGVATYNVHPPKAGLYFNKIQCFCFEEQRLGPKEEIDMPVFFFIDPEFAEDPVMRNVENIVLAYTFFKTGEEEVEPKKPPAAVVAAKS
jgi:cytochrome c oxidase assembly protein subunit 11